MPDQLDERIREALRSEVAALPFTLTAVAVERRLDRRPVPLRFVVFGGLAAAAVVLVVAFLATTLLAPRPNVGPPGPGTPTPTSAPTSTPAPTPAVSLADGGGLALSLVEVPLTTAVGTLDPYLLYDGERFVSYGSIEQPAIGYTSTDGNRWQLAPDGLGAIPAGPTSSWNGTVLTWSTGTRLAVLKIWHSDGSTTIHQFSDADINGAAIGPRGIVVLASSGMDEAGQPIDPSWGGGWFSETGETWTEMSNPPRSTGGLALTGGPAAGPDGFYARTFDGGMWRSADGMDWEEIDPTATATGALVPWHDGVLSIDRPYEYWTADGGRALPIPAGTATGSDYVVVRGAGPMGIVTVDRGAGVVIASADGQTWSEVPLPQRDWVSMFDGFEEPSLAVGQDATLILLWEYAPDGSKVASLWRLTIE